MWFKRKTKEEKLRDLQKEVDKLNEIYKNKIDSYCKINNWIFILKGFEIEDNKIFVKFQDKETPKDYINYISINHWDLKYDIIDFKVARYQFVKFKDNLEKIGLKLEKI